MKKILTFFVALTATMSLSAGSYYLKNNWNGDAESWIELTEDDGAYTGIGVFGGNDFAINSTASDEGARVIKVENAHPSINMVDAELSVGDKVFFVYNPDEYASMDPKASGLFSMIIDKNGYALKNGASWKNLKDDDPDDHDWWVLEGAEFAGEDVAVINGSNLRTIKVENINASINTDKAELSAGDSVLFIFRPSLENGYNEKESGLQAMITFKNGYAIKNGASWKNLKDDDEEEHDWWILAGAEFAGEDVAIINEANLRNIRVENINASINTDVAELSAGDSVLFIFRPSLENRYDEKESGLQAMITFKNGYAIKNGASWKNLKDDDEEEHDWWILAGAEFAGEDVAIINEANLRNIKIENINASINTDVAELSAGDSVLFIFRPSLENRYDEKESGLYAMISFKNGYAIKNGASWKNLKDDDPEDHDWWVLAGAEFAGEDVAVINGSNLRNIKIENINASINTDVAELSAGDSVLFIFRPSLENRYNEKESGLYAMISFKNGYAIKNGASWKNLKDDDEEEHDWWVLAGAEFAGEDVAIINEANLRNIKIENINASINTDVAELSAGDSVLFIFRPSLENRYNEKESGLYAMISFKNGYAIKNGASWKNLKDDDEEEHDWWVLEGAEFAGEDVAVINGSNLRTIKVENINASINTDKAELSAGDSVLFIFRPSLENRYNEKESGLYAMISFKNGYAIKNGASWKNLKDDDEEEHDWWVLEGAEFAGEDVAVINGSNLRTIKVENINASINTDEAELSAGDSVLFIFRPSLENRYDEKESGLYAMISFKNGYALMSTWCEKSASWKNMVEQDEDTYLVENVLFDGEDVVLLNGSFARTIKVENIKAYLLPSYEEAVLEVGDLVVFMYTPSEYNRYDETQSGLSALIVEKQQETAIDNAVVDTKAVKMIQNGQLFIINNGTIYNAAGVVVK